MKLTELPASSMIAEVLGNWVSLQRSQWLNRVKLAEMRDGKLRAIVNYAYQDVPFYRRLFETVGLAPSDILEISDIRKIPIVSRECYGNTPLQDRTAAGANVNSCMTSTTSGSTGTPVTILDDPAYAAYQEALNMRYLWAYGVRPLDRICRVMSRPRIRITDKQGLWSRLRRKVTKITYASEIQEPIGFFSAWKPNVVIAEPSYYRALIRVCEERGQRINFKTAITWAEMLDAITRKRIEESFGAEVFDLYAAEETGILAWECPTHSGYHVNIDSVVMEFLREGEPVVAGNVGQVYVTCFHRKVMPIIRYSLGDAATPLEDDCPCGRSLPLVKNIQGRTLDFILTADGGQVSPYVVMSALSDVNGIEQFKVTQRKDFSIEFLVKAEENEVGTVSAKVSQLCRGLFGDTAVSIQFADKIEGIETRKFRLVESCLST